MTREEAIKILTGLWGSDFSACLTEEEAEANAMAVEALAKMEVIQKVIDMPFKWEQDDRRRYAKVVDIVRKDLTQEVEL